MKYATCKRCEAVLPRDEMLSVNVHFFKEMDKKDIVRVRLCPDCCVKMQHEMKAIEWKNELFHCNGRFGEPRLRGGWGSTFAHSDDSEAAMRKKGKQVDVTY